MKLLMIKNKSCISVILLSAFFLHSCSSWYAATPNQLRESDKKPLTQFYLRNGEKIETRYYFIATDTLVLKAPKSLFYTGAERCILLEEIEEIQIHKVDWQESIVLTVILALIIRELWKSMRAYSKAIEAMGA